LVFSTILIAVKSCRTATYYNYIKILIHVLVVFVSKIYNRSGKSDIIPSMFYSFYILDFIYCPRKTRNPSLAFLLCAAVSKWKYGSMCPNKFGERKARSKSVSVNTNGDSRICEWNFF
jgi:hypothetical protein